MKLMAQLAVIGALVTGATTLNAQVTNITLNVSITLNGVVQTDGSSAKGKIGTKDVIQAIQPGASNGAKLIARFSPSGGDPIFIIRDGSTETVVDPSVMGTTQAGNSVEVVNTNNKGVATGKVTEIREWFLSTDTISFDVQGYTTSNVSNKGLNGETFDSPSPTSTSSKVAGNIQNAQGPGVAQGTISLGGRKITVIGTTN